MPNRGGVMKENDIRPAHIFEEYLRLSSLDTERFFDSERREEIPCPACGSGRTAPSFVKRGFGYSQCVDCATLYQTPRPYLEQFEQFYRDSASSNYWAEVFFPTVLEKRRDLIFSSRVIQIRALCEQAGFIPSTLMDVGAGYGLLLEEWRKVDPSTRLLAVEPSKRLAEVCRSKGIEVLETLAEQAQAWEELGQLVTCFEVLEHVHDPAHFVRCLYRLASPNGYVVVGCLGVEGFDIQVLWERSKSISPPHHINFLSIRGFEALFKRVGFAEVKVITPGKLDVDIVKNAFSDSTVEEHRFTRTLLHRGEETLKAFQHFLAMNRLSSHVWVIARKC